MAIQWKIEQLCNVDNISNPENLNKWTNSVTFCRFAIEKTFSTTEHDLYGKKCEQHIADLR